MPNDKCSCKEGQREIRVKQRRGRLWDHRARDWNDVDTSQGGRRPPEGGRDKESLLLEPPEGVRPATPCLPTLASRAGENAFPLLGTSEGRLWQPQNLR